MSFLSRRIVPTQFPTTASPARIAFVGEAPGEREEQFGVPLVGASGQEFDAMLADAGITRTDCLVTNVFRVRPRDNVLAEFGVERDSASPASLALGPMTSNPTLFVTDELLPDLDRLWTELEQSNTNVIVPLGSTACWALGLGLGITTLRGTVHRWGDYKVLPTFHPAYVMRQWNHRTIAVQDFIKADREAAYPDTRYDNAELWIEPTLADLHDFASRFLDGAERIAVDVETKRGEITCLGFAPSADRAIVVPFRLDPLGAGVCTDNYWPDALSERAAWRWVERIAKGPAVKVMQNGMYDIQYFIRHGIQLRNFTEDTMLMHHSLYSELPKDLGFLGSIYCNHGAWKLLAGRYKDDLKKDD